MRGYRETRIQESGVRGGSRQVVDVVVVVVVAAEVVVDYVLRPESSTIA